MRRIVCGPRIKMLRCIISSPVQRPLPIHAGINIIRKGERATVVANSLSSFLHPWLEEWSFDWKLRSLCLLCLYISRMECVVWRTLLVNGKIERKISWKERVINKSVDENVSLFHLFIFFFVIIISRNVVRTRGKCQF